MTNTFVAALRCNAVTAPCVIDGAMNGEKFLAYVEQFLVPELRTGDLVIMNNLPSQKITGVCEATEAVGASLLSLPSLRLDPHPIELVFAKLKSLLRKADARTIESLWAQLAHSLHAFTPPRMPELFPSCWIRVNRIENGSKSGPRGLHHEHSLRATRGWSIICTSQDASMRGCPCLHKV
jgi:transposase